VLTTHFTYLKPASQRKQGVPGNTDSGEIAGEYQALMEQEFYDFVLVEIPWIIL